MSFELSSSSDHSVVYVSPFSAADFETPKLLSDKRTLTSVHGEATLEQWIFSGMRMAYSDCTFKEPATFDWRSDVDCITACFSLQGKWLFRHPGHAETHELTSNKHNLFYGQQSEGRVTPEKQHVKAFTLQLSKKAFFEIAATGNETIKRFADHVARARAAAFSSCSLDIDLGIQQCINAVLNCRYENELKQLFLFSKAVELLVLQAESLNRAQLPEARYVKNEYDRERILFARNYLLQHMDYPPGLSELARIAGINEYKLKRGFKEMFNQTVFEYLAETRLEIARTDLLEKRKSVTQIAFELGYASLSHFSTAFKKKFGVAPSKLR